MTQAREHLIEDEARRERRLLLKLDRNIIPLTALLYLAAFLDRGNTGNAKLQGLLEIYGTDADRKYDITLTCFYVTYIAFNIPGNILSSVIRPNLALGLAAATWGVSSTAQAGATNFAGMVVCRLFIGIGEAGFGAAVPVYYGLWYRRDEIAVRLALYIGAGSLAGAFGGLIAYGVSYIHSHLATWRILFLIEGAPTIVLAAAIAICLPGTPETSRYITEEERSLVQSRLHDSGVSVKHTFDRSAIRAVFTTHTTYLNGLIYMGMNLSLSSVSGFLPTIIRTMGWSESQAQLMSVPPYAVAFVGTITVCYLSDKLRTRGPFVMLLMLLSATGFAILLGEHHNNHVRYFATFLVVLGAFATCPLMMSWAGNTAGSQSAAALRMGSMNAIGHASRSVLATFVFPTQEGPHWTKGFAINLAFNAIAAATAVYLSLYYHLENKRRDVAQGAGVVETPENSFEDGSDSLSSPMEAEKWNWQDEDWREVKKHHDASGQAELPIDLHHNAPAFRFFT